MDTLTPTLNHQALNKQEMEALFHILLRLHQEVELSMKLNSRLNLETEVMLPTLLKQLPMEVKNHTLSQQQQLQMVLF
jgi:hypothetical protein